MAPLVRKPLAVLLQEEESGQLVRSLTLLDLTAIGIGGTVGSGVFPVVGSVAANDCGPSVILAILFGAAGCTLTGNAYVKLSRAIPSTSSVYAPAYHTLGEVGGLLKGLLKDLQTAFQGPFKSQERFFQRTAQGGFCQQKHNHRNADSKIGPRG